MQHEDVIPRAPRILLRVRVRANVQPQRPLVIFRVREFERLFLTLA
jgi:hypothetical protein